MRTYLIIFLVVVLVFVTYFTGFFFPRIRALNNNLSLEQENQELLAEIQGYAVVSSSQILVAQNGESLKAIVFSTYPFNTKNLITLNVGQDQGIKSGMTVTLRGNVLIGQVKDVFKNTCDVQTIFDPNMQLPVRIGDQEIDGLLQGGNEPKVVLVEKTKPVNVGDFVYSAGSEYPYGLKVGEISEVKESIAGIFKEVSLKVPFNISDLREVAVLLNR